MQQYSSTETNDIINQKRDKTYIISKQDIIKSGETKTCLDKVHIFTWNENPENHIDVEVAMRTYLNDKTTKNRLIAELEAQQRGLELVCMFQGIRMHNPDFTDEYKEHYMEFEQLLENTTNLINKLIQI